VSVTDRIVEAPDGNEYVVEAWHMGDVLNGLGLVLGWLMPWWNIGVKRFPVSFGARSIHVERTLTASAAQRRVDELARQITVGRIPRR
jgi:hypothetical protein